MESYILVALHRRSWAFAIVFFEQSPGKTARKNLSAVCQTLHRGPAVFLPSASFSFLYPFGTAARRRKKLAGDEHGASLFFSGGTEMSEEKMAKGDVTWFQHDRFGM
ncbi:MAG: hypothetical protein N2512_11105, partial [Armatimonadetes bacterium]|nr:hypothetical protein [Armatimonadota bacterium]